MILRNVFSNQYKNFVHISEKIRNHFQNIFIQSANLLYNIQDFTLAFLLFLYIRSYSQYPFLLHKLITWKSVHQLRVLLKWWQHSLFGEMMATKSFEWNDGNKVFWLKWSQHSLLIEMKVTQSVEWNDELNSKLLHYFKYSFYYSFSYSIRGLFYKRFLHLLHIKCFGYVI